MPAGWAEKLAADFTSTRAGGSQMKVTDVQNGASLRVAPGEFLDPLDGFPDGSSSYNSIIFSNATWDFGICMVSSHHTVVRLRFKGRWEKAAKASHDRCFCRWLGRNSKNNLRLRRSRTEALEDLWPLAESFDEIICRKLNSGFF
jgi:hypothetical protein